MVGVERSLRRGEMLLLIMGDRIRSNTERLVDLLRKRVNLGFSFGLVEMPVYSAGARDPPAWDVAVRPGPALSTCRTI